MRRNNGPRHADRFVFFRPGKKTRPQHRTTLDETPALKELPYPYGHAGQLLELSLRESPPRFQVERATF